MKTATPASTTGGTLPSDEELMALPRDGCKREMLNGEIVMSPAGSEHGRKIMRLATQLASFVYQHHLGEVFDGQTGFRMKSRDVLSPDISFVRADRLAGLDEAPEGFFEGAPDLAIEFLSPAESRGRLTQKLTQYFDSGARLAWVIDPATRTVMAQRDNGSSSLLNEEQELDGEEVVPGFRLPILNIFAGIDYRR